MYKRDSSFRSSPIAKDPSHYAKYEVSSSPEEWEFVERLLPSTIIPAAPKSKNLPSGWKPQTGNRKIYYADYFDNANRETVVDNFFFNNSIIFIITNI